MKLEFKLQLKGIDGVEGKTDKDIFLEWLRACVSQSQAQTDPFYHIFSENLFSKIDSAAQTHVDLTPLEFDFVRLAFARANIGSASNKIYVQFLSKLGLFTGTEK